jgi:hypothetical protein
LANGEIALFHAAKNSELDCRPVMRISTDEAKTWGEPVKVIPDKEVGYYVINNDRVVQLKSGRLVVPVVLHNSPAKPAWIDSGIFMCYLSDDDGRTWRRSRDVENDEPRKQFLQEPGVVELKDGRLMAFCRTAHGSQYLSYSSDGGETWTEFAPSSIISPCSPASIERIPSTGDLLLVWNNHDKIDPARSGMRTPFNAAISKDDGKTWQDIKTLANERTGWYCYTAVEFVDDQVLLGHCAGDTRENNGLAVTQITRFPVKWLYQTTRTPPSDTPGKLILKEKTLLQKPSPLQSAFYVNNAGVEMMTYRARSTDDGRSWISAEPKPDFQAGLPPNFRRSPYPGFVDPVSNQLLCVVFAMDRPDVDKKVVEPEETGTDSYIRYRVSIDQGKTFLFDEPVIQKGDYNFKHPLDGLYLGKNAIFLGDEGCVPIRTQRGNILVPTQITVLNAEGKLDNFGGGWDYYHCLMLIGTWKKDHRLDWQVSEQIKADPTRTVRGLYEPTLAEMPDGRILCVMRGSNGHKKDPAHQLPGRKWHSISTDGGFHWSKPEPWRYSDGETFFSPASMSQLITHSNGRYYWIGNICPTNSQANSPRWPLVIGEVDPKSMMLIKESVITIDTRLANEPEGMTLSNFHAFEDRPSGDIILPMQRWLPSDHYEPVLYRIGTAAE